MSDGKHQDLVMSYLYGEMTAEEKEAFERRARGDDRLRHMLAAERQLSGLLAAARSVEVDDDLLRESRLQLRGALRVSRPRLWLWGRIADALAKLPTPAVRGVSMAALLLFGVWLGRTTLSSGDAVAAVTPASLIQPGDLEIVGLRIDRFDAASGQVELAFDAVSSVRVAGTLADESVQSVLSAAVEGHLESAERLQTVDLMKHLASSERIREALMYALLHDDNPAVRLRAIETLKALVVDDGVRAALRNALMSDRNPGVRVEAIDALKAVRDAATAAVLERKAIDDGNGYIRAEAERTLSRWKEAAGEQL